MSAQLQADEARALLQASINGELPDERGRFGPFGGRYIPETLVPDMIDELPLLMALAATAPGITRIRGAAELRVKESDRLAVMAVGLQKLGVELTEYPDGIDININCLDTQPVSINITSFDGQNWEKNGNVLTHKSQEL